MRSLRRTKEGIQILTALEKAEQELSEAIEMAKLEAERTKRHEVSRREIADSSLQRDHQEDAAIQTKYNFIPMDEEGSSESEKNVPFVADSSKKSDTDWIDKETADVRSLYNIALDDEGFRDKSILNQSKEYEMESFNEIDLVSGILPEPEVIMPSSFLLENFEEDEEIMPYAMNEAFFLGEELLPSTEEREPQSVADLLDRAQAEAEAGIGADNSFEDQNSDLRNKGLAIVQQAKKEANEILDNAAAEALDIKKRAVLDAERILEEKIRVAEAAASEKGYGEGFEKGQNEGYLEAAQATNRQMIEEAKAFKEELLQSLQEFEVRKKQLLEEYLNDLTDLAIVAAEKIIKISLKSSKDIISKIIVAAAEDCRNKDWAKVYISNDDKALTLNLEKGLIDALRQISPNIKVVVMEDEPTGTCIIETPDQIIDASVDVQLDAIKQIVNDNEL
ncbi:FliH/SctL family protein [Clostridium aminobutyricum]|uniref:Flagellar assembly protein FliH/Type III secretion system HrpE domain-containing protein n=1 Tax=Clostridium aminobutyricum TaxID=33953 RepID=A0A939IGR4_CLOAM|nr:FliH/SctL family protein [Clostridium aminobutyricum]MBN7773770.1 hypothetical protein [Clostridium aminobutyricum]